MHYFKVSVTKTSTSNSCSTDVDCLPTYFCSNTTCHECSGKCFRCSGSKDNCLSCSRFSKEWEAANKTSCNGKFNLFTFLVNYINLNNFQNIFFKSVPVPTSNRITAGLWIFMDKLLTVKKLVHIVFPDFFVMTLVPVMNLIGVRVYCFKYQGIVKGQRTEDVITSNDFPLDKDVLDFTMVEMEGVNGMWFYAKCGFNYEGNAIYTYGERLTSLSGKSQTHTHTGVMNYDTLFSVNNSINVKNDFFYRKFYRETDTMTIEIRNAGSFYIDSASVVFQNLYMFSEYLDSKIHFHR